jgi:hypothetical protein
VDNPLADDAAAIASSFGRQSQWNQQIVIGSPLRVRTRGMAYDDAGFPGYRLGKNRDGAGMDVVAELRNPQTLGGQRYDALVITERNDLALSLQYEDTVRYARHFHERFVDGNPQGNSFLYHAWYGVRDKANPSPWIAHERAAAPVWQCVASRINLSLAHEGRADRMHYMPAGLALAELVERATRGYLDGISGSSVSDTMNRLFLDDVHLNRLGSYYMSLVHYASVFRTSPIGAWAPAGISSAAARSLQDTAWSVVAPFLANPPNPSMDSCQALVRDSFCSSFSQYTGQSNPAVCASHFASADQPFRFSPASDRSYWFASPR